MHELRKFALAMMLAFAGSLAMAQEPAEQPSEEQVSDEISEDEAVEAEQNGNGVDSPKTMSGMSILGNEEAPKSLVIIPWKSSKLGDDISLSDTLDDRAQPVDKEVFLRELRFYELRSDEQT